MSPSPSRDRAQTSARSEFAMRAPLASPCRKPGAHDPQIYPHVVHVASRLRTVTGAARRIAFHSLNRGGGIRLANGGLLDGSLWGIREPHVFRRARSHDLYLEP